MNNSSGFEISKPAVCIGTGFMALDIVVNGDRTVPPRLWAGGSCGNVMIILSSLGWKSFPVARLGRDAAAERIVAELKKFNVLLDFVQFDEKAGTPVIIEQIKKGADGTVFHRFFRICPYCGKWLPGYRTIPLKMAQSLKGSLPKAESFYFDRATPGTLELAQASRAHGALVVFEPPSAKDEKLFQRAIRLSHIVKYSNENIDDLRELASATGPLLIVQTMGDQGIRYKLRGLNDPWSTWKMIEAFSVKRLKDAAGSGDWCTAGIIHLLGRGGAARLENIEEDEVVNALKFGQALAALNCCFEGARGGMYVLSKAEFENEVGGIMSRKFAECPIASQGVRRHVQEGGEGLFHDICGFCKGEPNQRRIAASILQ
jgi:fructokinase